MKVLETERLILRTFDESDLEPMYRINQDKQVMEYFPGLQSLEQTKELIRKIQKHFDEHGFSLYAITLKSTGEFIGFTGLLTVTFHAPFTPAIEIGWRLDSKHWGQGYATEAAQSVLEYAFHSLKIDEVMSFTACHNLKSRRVMEKLGMKYNKEDDFIHPNVPNTYPALKAHVLYRLKSSEHLSSNHH